MKPRPRSLAALAALLVVVAACGSATSAPGSSPPAASGAAPSGSTATAACPTSPAPAADLSGWGPPSQTPSVIPVIAMSSIACGQVRFMFLFVDPKTNVPLSAPDRTATVAFYDLGKDPGKPVATVDAGFVWGIPNERGFYVANADLPQAGVWGAEITTGAPGAPKETIRLQFDVQDSSPTIQVGDKAPASKTPTLADVGGDVTKISTDKQPVKAFYETSVAQALTAHKPFVLVFATPKFCQTAQCGPTLDRLKPVARAHPDVTFINVEPYQLKDDNGQLQPVLDAQNQPVPTATTDQWGLLSEPWIFVVDRDGVVRGSFATVVGDAELEAALAKVEPGP